MNVSYEAWGATNFRLRWRCGTTGSFFRMLARRLLGWNGDMERFRKMFLVCSDYCLIEGFNGYILCMTNDHLSTESGEDFTRLLLQNQKRIWGLILSLVPGGPDADDILQETCAVMWRKYAEFEPGTDFAAWGLKIARFQVMRYYSRRKTERARLSDDVIEAVAARFAAPDQEKRVSERSVALRDCLAKLKSVQFDTLHRRYDEGQSVEEIASELNVSIHAIYKRLDRTYQQLHLCINKTISQRGQLA